MNLIYKTHYYYMKKNYNIIIFCKYKIINISPEKHKHIHSLGFFFFFFSLYFMAECSYSMSFFFIKMSSFFFFFTFLFVDIKLFTDYKDTLRLNSLIYSGEGDKDFPKVERVDKYWNPIRLQPNCIDNRITNK